MFFFISIFEQPFRWRCLYSPINIHLSYTYQNKCCFLFRCQPRHFLPTLLQQSHHALICPHNYSQSTIPRTPHYQKLYENESNTHIQTQTHVLNYTNALTYKYKYSQLTLTDLSLSYLYYCRNTFTHPNNPYTNKLVSCGRL